MTEHRLAHQAEEEEQQGEAHRAAAVVRAHCEKGAQRGRTNSSAEHVLPLGDPRDRLDVERMHGEEGRDQARPALVGHSRNTKNRRTELIAWKAQRWSRW